MKSPRCYCFLLILCTQVSSLVLQSTKWFLRVFYDFKICVSQMYSWPLSLDCVAIDTILIDAYNIILWLDGTLLETFFCQAILAVPAISLHLNCIRFCSLKLCSDEFQLKTSLWAFLRENKLGRYNHREKFSFSNNFPEKEVFYSSSTSPMCV